MFEKNTNFEYKIFSKQEGQIRKDHNSLSKNQKKPKSNLAKEKKNNVFWDIFFFKKQPKQLFEITLNATKTQRSKEEHKESLQVTN